MGKENEIAGEATRVAPQIPFAGRIMGIDWGTRRIGVAITDPGQIIGQPLATLSRRDGKRFPLSSLRPYIEDNEVVGVVVGLPLAEDGGESEASLAARQTGELIAARTKLPVAYQDERFSTAHALAAIKEMGGSTRNRKGDVDQLSAAIMLQAFLDRRCL